MVFYMNNDMKNDLLKISALDTFAEEMSEKKMNHPREEKIHELMKKAHEYAEKAMKEMVAPCERKQQKQLMRLSACMRVIVVTDADSRAKEHVVEFTEEEARYMSGVCAWNECKMCERNENEMKKCRLRYIFKRAGTKEIPDGFGTGACEYSRL